MAFIPNARQPKKPAVKPAAVGDLEWTAAPLRPVAHWVSMPAANGRSRLSMVWEIPDPMPLADGQ